MHYQRPPSLLRFNINIFFLCLTRLHCYCQTLFFNRTACSGLLPIFDGKHTPCYFWLTTSLTLDKIAIIETESECSYLYIALGTYNVVLFIAAYKPKPFIKTVNILERSSKNVIIVDSLSHECKSDGGILDMRSHIESTSFANWTETLTQSQRFSLTHNQLR